MERLLNLSFGALLSVPFVMVLSNSLLIPELPSMQHAMGITLFEVGLIITAFSIPAGLAIPFGGYLADQYGRKRIMIPALVVFGAGGLVAGVAPLLAGDPFYVILGGRVIQGIGAGGLYQVAMALTGDLYQDETRSQALGLLETANGVGKVASPLMGAALGLIIWYAPFYAYPVLAWPAAAAVWLFTREPEGGQQPRRSQYIRTLRRLAERKGTSLAATFLAGFMALFALFGMLSYFSDILENRFGIDGFTRGLYVAIPVLGMSVVAYLSGTYAKQSLARLLRPAAAAGTVVLGLGVALLFPAQSLFAVTAAMLITGIGTGMLLPALNTLITSASKWSERGLITAFYGSVRFFGAALGPPYFGLIATTGQALILFSTAAAAAATAAVVFLVVHEERLLPKQLRQPGSG